MATTTPATSSQHTTRDEQPAAGQAVVVQLAVQGWATTHRPGSAGPPDDPCDPLDPAA